MAACSSSISAATCSNSASTFPPYNKTLSLETPFVSIKTHLKTYNFTLRFKAIYPDFSPLSRSSFLPPNCSQLDGLAQVIGNPETALSENKDKEEESEAEPVDSRRLFVGNIPFTLTSAKLMEIFGEAGTVVSVELIYDKVTGRSRGFAFVVMSSAQEAKEAMQMFNGSQVGGRMLKVNFPEVPKGGERKVMEPKIRTSQQKFVESPHKIYAGNLSWIVTSEKLREAFAEQPGLLSAKVIYDKDSGKSKGFGFVTFDSPEAVDSALSSMNGKGVEGRPLRLNLALQRSDTARTSSEGSSYERNVDESDTISSDST